MSYFVTDQSHSLDGHCWLHAFNRGACDALVSVELCFGGTRVHELLSWRQKASRAAVSGDEMAFRASSLNMETHTSRSLIRICCVVTVLHGCQERGTPLSAFILVCKKLILDTPLHPKSITFSKLSPLDATRIRSILRSSSAPVSRGILKLMVPFRALVWVAALLPLLLQCSVAVTEVSCSEIVPMKLRREVISITDFGAVGDGRTLNTWPFKKAIYRIQHLRSRGGTLLYIPPGVWLTGSFSLTSHMTLYLARGAVIKATQVLLLVAFSLLSQASLDSWHLQQLLKSVYPQQGLSLDSQLFKCRIHGAGLWQTLYHHMEGGESCPAGDTGWDEYGIAYGRPSSGITIRRLQGSSPFSGIAIGSETSGGVENVLVENINLYNTGFGIHIKTNAGRGGYIRNVTVVNVSMNKVRKGIRIAGDVGDHPDEYFNRYAMPTVDGVTIKNVWGVDIQQPGSIEGIRSSPFTRICLSNVKLWSASMHYEPWKCMDVSGAALGVQPWPCSQLTGTFSAGFCSSAF
ncbi:hypothetical protein BHM03_00012009 [Ensete ventricosum]|uniref:Pectate lyase superfamily protein domain-containing protein n=1 Tax=Ensete ventricosum TaxID=4639 RepID=A0A445MDI2_ENSVE|nr:hypothetical protein BHM03_00012009 [Ensete ventricosum]